MIGLIAARSMSRIALSAPSAVCSLSRASRTIHVAAVRQGRSRRKPVKGCPPQQQIRPAASRGLYTAAAMSVAGVGQAGVLTLGAASAGQLPLQEQVRRICALSGHDPDKNLRCSPTVNGKLPLSASLEIQLRVIYQLACMGDLEAEACSSRWLGQYPELVQMAEDYCGDLKLLNLKKRVRGWLRGQPDLLKSMGVSNLDRTWHIDHVLPVSKGGRDHPANYFLMPAKENHSFGGRISLKKCMYVGMGVSLQVALFHSPQLHSWVIWQAAQMAPAAGAARLASLA